MIRSQGATVFGIYCVGKTQFTTFLHSVAPHGAIVVVVEGSLGDDLGDELRVQLEHLAAPLLHGTVLLGSLLLGGAKVHCLFQLVDLTFEALLKDQFR